MVCARNTLFNMGYFVAMITLTQYSGFILKWAYKTNCMVLLFFLRTLRNYVRVYNVSLHSAQHMPLIICN